MRRLIFILLLCTFFSMSSQAQVYGCMDPASSNYNSAATVSNGSCKYPEVLVSLKNMRKAILPEPLHEISGIICFEGKLYGHNDSGGDPAIYEMDTITGVIIKTITLQGATNVDWEDITQDDTYVYVGDIGNNESGNRTDLKIYRFPKQAIRNIKGASGTVPSSDIEVVHFKYEDQTDFSPSPAQSTRFDCEALIYDNGKLHLFTKNWLSNYTVHYVLNATPAPEVQVAVRKDSLNTEGVVITAAANVGYKSTVLLGYQVTGVPAGFMWIITGYSDMGEIFTTGNKRKINLGGVVDGLNSGIGQVEGIALAKAGRVFITNEYFSRTVSGFKFEVSQSLYGLDISSWIPANNVLAIGITSLTAFPDHGQMVIQWSYDEFSFDHFEVESSGDGKNFSKAGTVNSGTAAHEFSFTDPALLQSGTVFYRVKVVLKNGHIVYSKVISVNETKQKHFNVSANPSPFHGVLHLNIFTDKDRQIQLNLFDLYGRKLLTSKWNCARGDSQYEWQNVSSLPKSVYYLTAQSGDEILVRKIVKD